MREALRALVAGSVEGLEPAAVTLVVSEVVTSVPPRRMAPERSGWGPALAGLVVLLLGGVAAGAGWLLRRRKSRSVSSAPATASVALRPVVQAPLARREAG